MLRLYTDLRMLEHRPHLTHPERPERLSQILKQLDRTGQRAATIQPEVRPATDEELLRIHSPNHLEAISRAGRSGQRQVEADTWVSPGSEVAARLAAGAVVDAIHDVVGGAGRRALCLVRPPGHHALPDQPMGFCLYGTVAVGVADALERLGVNRVLIVDWDVHHGNGTQKIFYEEPRVGFFSIHRHPFYPGGGTDDETGTGRGLGTTRNVPIAFGTPPAAYLGLFETRLEAFADRLKPELIVISAGFDAHAEDPVGNLGLDFEHFIRMSQTIVAIADQHCAGRIVSVLEGGYNVPILAGCVSDHMKILSEDQA